ncbi:hypothetical protein [Acidobacterium sp. S8]|uniref:hypothetical protein n=1 Tax=Acidobacterium sp. S8 TaxID=1641854 RepID=UPI00131E43C4|nr:hypothetical protein [Acidobacterium sp. S8]
MLNVLRRIDEPEHPVLSLTVQANMVQKEVVQMDSFSVLVRHFFDRFFDNPLTSLEGENATRIAQILCIIAVPALLFALTLIPSYFIFPPNTAPRGYWPRVSDHYFYVMYASMALGAGTVFEWDMLFPDFLDILVLTPLPVPARRFFTAKIAALGKFLGLFLIASGCLGTIFLPLIADEPSLIRHLAAHIIAITAGGLFTACFFISLQGILLSLLGEKLFRWISPLLQAVSLASLLIIVFLFPLISQNLQLLLTSGNATAHWFPPFWFLGLYQVILEGRQALPVFGHLAATGAWALLIILTLTCLSYPLAYWTKMRRAIEGLVQKTGRNRIAEAKDYILHKILILRPPQRAVYHFVSQTLKQAPHHRVYLSLYGGAGLALLLATTIQLQQHNGHIALAFSSYGLRSTIPVVAFLAISGLKAAFLSPVELKASWLFSAIGTRPDRNHIAATLRWTLLRTIFLTVATLLVIVLLSPSLFPAALPIAAQLLVAQGLCLLLVDIFFLRFLSVPFTVPLIYSKRNLAFYAGAFLALFGPFIFTVVDAGFWMEQRLWHLLIAAALILIAHALLQRWQRSIVDERASLPEDFDLDEFPQRLGLS